MLLKLDAWLFLSVDRYYRLRSKLCEHGFACPVCRTRKVERVGMF